MYKYILVCAWLFTLLDWKVIQLTRFAHRDWLEWMHAHERQYAAVVFTGELVLCTPAFALKPLLRDAVIQVEANPAQIKSITHAPKASLSGFWMPVQRGKPYKFVSWSSWFAYWLAPSILWMWAWKSVWKHLRL